MAAVLAADMVGFSRLMEADESGTVSRQKHLFDELIIPVIDSSHGRIVKLTGDGLLVEFASVVDAVRCAVEIQREIAKRTPDRTAANAIQYRMAVNLGDVIPDGEDIYGDGVNIAARLEQFAEPGGVVVSGTAYDHLKANIDVGYEDLGEQRLKNIASPVRVYRIIDAPEAAGTMVKSGRRRWPLAVVALVILAAVGSGWWSFTGARQSTASDSLAELKALPGIAVLPFENLSTDAEQSYFAIGLTEELTARLTQFNNIRVIARNSTSRIEAEKLDLREMSEALDARYIVQGSVRRSADSIRVTALLIDGETGDHLWSSSYDEELERVAFIQFHTRRP